MWDFLVELVRAPSGKRTIMILGRDGAAAPRHFHVNTRELSWVWAGSVAGAFLLAVGLFVFTPARTWLPGATTHQMHQTARNNALQLAALRDSFAIQQQYVAQLQRLVTGRIDSTVALPVADREEARGPYTGGIARITAAPEERSPEVRTQPTFLLGSFPVEDGSNVPAASPVALPPQAAGLSLPVLPPVEGFATRGFEAQEGHFAVDIAVEEGTMVHAVGEGYVIVSDWTHDGGYTLAVQHTGGYVSVYKHNSRLLKHVGDRVRAREPIALSGNTGEITSGPHLHFELWRHGLALDPQHYFAGW